MTDKEKESKKILAVLVSYIPFIDLESIRQYLGQYKEIKSTEDFQKAYQDIFNRAQEKMPQTRGVVWAHDNDKIHAVIIVDNHAQELTDHMKIWADGQPDERFKYDISRTDDTETSYRFTIIADPKSSIKRYITANQQQGDKKISHETHDFKIITIPITTYTNDDEHLLTTQELYDATHNPEHKTDLFSDDIPINVSFANVKDLLDEDQVVNWSKFQEYAEHCEYFTLNRLNFKEQNK